MEQLIAYWAYIGPILFLLVLMILCAVVYRLAARGDGALRERSSWRNLMLWGVRFFFSIAGFATLFCITPKSTANVPGWLLLLILCGLLTAAGILIHLLSPTGGERLRAVRKRLKGRNRSVSANGIAEPIHVFVAAPKQGEGASTPEDAERDYGLLLNVVFHTLLILAVFLGLVAPILFRTTSGNWGELMVVYGRLSRGFALVGIAICLRETVYHAHGLQNGFDAEKDELQKTRKDIRERNAEVVSFLSRKCTKI